MPLNRVARAALGQLRSVSEGKGWVFISTRGDRLQGARHWFEPAIEEAEIENFHWHDLRHTFASRLIMAGVDLRTVQELMGHKSISMTVRYSHLAPTHQLAAVELLVEVSKAAQIEVPTDTKTSTDVLVGVIPDPAYVQ